jgi:addiction module HigA family antidote
LRITTREKAKMAANAKASTDRIPTPTIGEILREEFLDPLEITPYRLAKELHVATSSILDLVHDKRRLSVDMALKLSRYFGTSDQFWLHLQNEIDVRNRKEELEGALERIHPVAHSA